ncbi:MFS transporter [Actinocatenispora thailandica]|uniref:MFS transporter n=1 Tax=Actinocatenispora thailandica TaxID=227318 RepID=UPI0019528853|nr:MFS transporter [Actinocatenispora thailandica]
MGSSQPADTVPWQSVPEVRAAQSRTVRLLAAAQIVGGIGVGASVSIGVLLAESIARSESYAGLARTSSVLGAALVGVPLALLAQRRGRRTALSTGWLAAAAGSALLVLAAVVASVPLLVVGMLLFGVGSATNLQGRYAAADLALPHHRARALSTVVWSTTVGAMIGPNLGAPGAVVAAALGLPRLAGAFVLSTGFALAAAALLRVGLRPDPLLLAQRRQPAAATPAGAPGTAGRTSPTAAARPVWRQLRRSPRAGFAFVTVVLGHTVMGAVMTMTPVSLAGEGMTLTVVGFTITAHVLGMYAFAPVVGWLADRIGQFRVMLLGQLTYLAAVLVAGVGHRSMGWAMAGLFLLGLGWSCSLVAGSAMLSAATEPSLRPAMQGTADTTMNLVAAVAAGLAGPLTSRLGFGGLNAAAAVLVAPVLLAGLVLWRMQRRPTRTPAAAR